MAEVPPGAITYARMLQRVREMSRPASIEALYELGMTIGDSLTAPGHESPISTMDDSTFARTARLMAGFSLLRDEVEGVIVDPDFFLALSKAHGDAVDIAFFRSLEATMDSGTMPVFVEQQTDYSGCMRFGTGAVVANYATWRTYVSRFPGRYRRSANERLDDVVQALLVDDCACGDRVSVIRELRRFLARFPRGALASRVRLRLRAVESGKAAIREHCRSG